MKKLILLLLIPIMMQGQTVLEKFKARQDSVMKANRERIDNFSLVSIDSSNSYVKRIVWLDEFITFWDEYAKECKADTVITGYSVVFDDSNNEPSLVGKMKPIYGQRTYPTLQGFIEFLRNKLGEN